ncbi:hypothetical protein HGM15179_020523 [Zosterops borbonicus]|uniref:Uncharacterized protein n=1 Tax=Zosterops borbonicus TaxID=364589 RepID=A0A8K1D659_9PASS|nr:hypothetical protein HGM15179_020523 [Zosterops borbonicus]
MNLGELFQEKFEMAEAPETGQAWEKGERGLESPRGIVHSFCAAPAASAHTAAQGSHTARGCAASTHGAACVGCAATARGAARLRQAATARSSTSACYVAVPPDIPQVWFPLAGSCPDFRAVLAPDHVPSPSEVQTPVLTFIFPLLAWEDLICEVNSALMSALISFVNTLLYDTGSLIRVRNYFNLSFGDREEGRVGILAQLYPGKEQGVYLPREKYIKPLVNLKVGPKEEAFQFLVDLGADKACIMKNQRGCEVSKDILEIVAVVQGEMGH